MDNKLPKLIVTDIDGVWTDGGMYYDQQNNEWKKFNTYDSAGVLFANALNIPVAIITGENTEIVKRRANKLNIELLFMGISKKLDTLIHLCNDLDISLKEVAYIGDDINDLDVLKSVGLSACPSSAPEYVKNICNFVCNKKGGEGAFREFVEKIIGIENLMEIISSISLEKQ